MPLGFEGKSKSHSLFFKTELHKVVDWSRVDKEDYLPAMERSPIGDIEIKHFLKAALTDDACKLSENNIGTADDLITIPYYPAFMME